MSLARRMAPIAALFALVALAVALTVPADSAGAADHLDAPGLMSPDNRADLDINDIYVFTGAPGTTVLAMTVSPAASADATFAPGNQGRYEFRIDTTGRVLTDIAYTTVFNSSSTAATIFRTTENGTLGELLGTVTVGATGTLKDGTRAFAGLRSDPFFFDLSGFLGTVEGIGDDALGDDPTDFFADLNTLAIVLEVPDGQLNDGGPIGVWGRTSRPNRGNWKQVDRLGRPAINTVLNSSGPIVQNPSKLKRSFNGNRPSEDADKYTPFAVRALQAYSALDTEGPYRDSQAEALAGVLLPDVLTFDKASSLPAPLNGRGLADDVIDVELRVVTGGDPLGLFDDRDADGGVNSDGVGPHDDYLSAFPYLGVPHP